MTNIPFNLPATVADVSEAYVLSLNVQIAIDYMCEHFLPAEVSHLKPLPGLVKVINEGRKAGRDWR
jgi:hypothetical protein